MEDSSLLLARKIRFQPKQSELWYWWNDDPTIDEIDYGGSRGGGKSGGARRCMLLRRIEHENTVGLIMRRTFPALDKSHIQPMFLEYPETRQWYNTTSHRLTIPGTGSSIVFGSAEQGMGAFYSAEFADILIDEAQEFSQSEQEQLSGSLRCVSNRGIVPKMVKTFMPGMSEDKLPPIGLAYLKRIVIDAITKPDGLTEEEKKKKRKFIQAHGWDNIEFFRQALIEDGIVCGKHEDVDEKCEACLKDQEQTFYSWPANIRKVYFVTRTHYGKTLAALSDRALRDAWIDGLWSTFEGQYFSQWSEARHVITWEEASQRIKPWHKRWRSGDWGYDHPFAFYWHVIDEMARVITYRELWGRKVGETQLGKEIATWSKGERYHGFPISWDAGKLSSRAHPKFPKSIQQLIADGMGTDSNKPHPADSSPGSRIAGARLMSDLLDSDIGGFPQWQITDNCPHLIECIPSLIRDPDNSEDVLKVDWSENKIGDDPYDGARMGLQFMLGATVKPSSVDIQERVAAVKDPTAKNLLAMKLQEEQRRRQQTRAGRWNREQ